jgi:hypothetical protein
MYTHTNTHTHTEKNNEVLSLQVSGTWEHHLKWSLSGSESQMLHVFSPMWNIYSIQIQAILWKTGH